MASKNASLFTASVMNAAAVPLAEKMRPQTLDDVIGHEHLTGADGILRHMVDNASLRSMIFWGPPGTGKTTLARIISQNDRMIFYALSAIFSGVNDLKSIFDKAKNHKDMGQQTCLFIDEIHRFNRAQQDCFLPVMEDGTIILIGATTENPSFALNAALLSRTQVITLEALSANDLHKLIRIIEKKNNLILPLTDDAYSNLTLMADGDGRYLINMVEAILQETPPDKLDSDALYKLAQKRMPTYDKTQDQHYNLISALHKSIRGSDENAALYWLTRMLQAGEDPNFLARRLVRIAYEDIGLSDVHAPTICLDAWNTYQRLGSPEGELALGQAVIYLALAPKSNAMYKAYKSANAAAKNYGSLNPPKHILNAPTSLMKDLGYGKGYKYDHDEEGGISGQHYFPDNMMREDYYHPTNRGFERDMSKRQHYYNQLRIKKRGEQS